MTHKNSNSKHWVVAVCGAALYSSWPFVAFYSTNLQFLGEFSAASRHTLWVCALTFLVLGFACLSLRDRRADKDYLQKSTISVIYMGFLMGNVLMILGGGLNNWDNAVGTVVAHMGAAVAGFTSAFFEIGWKYILLKTDSEQFERNVALASCLSKLIASTVMLTLAPSIAVTLLAIVVVSPLLLVICIKFLPMGADILTGASSGEEPLGALGNFERYAFSFVKRQLWSIGFVVMFFWLGYCLVENIAVPGRMMSSPLLFVTMLCDAVVALAVALVFIRFSKTISFQAVLGFLSPVLCAVMLLCWIDGGSFVLAAYVAASALQLLASILLWSAGLTFQRRYGLGFSHVQGCIRMFLYIGVIGASLILSGTQDTISETWFFGTAILLLTSAMLAFGYQRRSRKDVAECAQEPMFAGLPQNSFAVCSRESLGESSIFVGECGDCGQSLGGEVAAYSSPGGDCVTFDLGKETRREVSAGQAFASIAAHYNLTPREAEIFELFAKGRDSAYIREKLFISKNTVGSHIKHIYKKLDVHSKQEMIDLVSEWKE